MQDYIKFANYLAGKAGDIIQKEYINTNDILIKPDKSLVTKIDKIVEKTLVQLIQEKYPTHSILGEEFGEIDNASEYKWVIDPIDGTHSFIVSRPIFGTLIALLKNDKPILGIIDQPILKQRWVGADGFATTLNGVKVKTSNCKKIEDAILATTSPEYFNKSELAFFNNIAKKAKATIYGGDCYNYALLASGKIDIIIESNLKSYDFCALAPVVKSASGEFVSWNKNEVNANSEGDIIAVANYELLKEINDLRPLHENNEG